MMLFLLIFAALALATYLSTLNHALVGLSRAALQRRLIDQGMPAAADWLHERMDAAILATALLRTFARMSIYMLALAWLIGLRVEATVNWWDLIISGLIAAVAIWFTTIVLGTAIAKHFGTQLVAASLPLLHAITLVCAPVTKAGELINRMFRKAMGEKNREEAGDEFLQTIEDSQREGALDVQSAEILENVVEFTNTEVSQVMTPRAEIEGIEYTDTLSDIREFICHAGHSRIPVYKGTVDNIVGVLYLKDLIRYLGEEAAEFKLSEHLRQPVVVPETKPVRELLSEFQHGEVHMAIVIDEYGSTAGLVTIEDVLEEIVGDIRDEHEPEEEERPEIKTIENGHAEVDGRLRIDELNELMHLDLPENGDYTTVAGFLMSHFGRVPEPGEECECHNARFTALQATPTQVQRVGVKVLQPVASNNGEHERWQQAAK